MSIKTSSKAEGFTIILALLWFLSTMRAFGNLKGSGMIIGFLTLLAFIGFLLSIHFMISKRKGNKKRFTSFLLRGFFPSYSFIYSKMWGTRGFPTLLIIIRFNPIMSFFMSLKMCEQTEVFIHIAYIHRVFPYYEFFLDLRGNVYKRKSLPHCLHS